MNDGERFRPSSGTEGDAFMGQWCAHCQFNSDGVDEEPCDTQLLALNHSIDDPEYPNAWCWQAKRPVCKEFRHKLDPVGDRAPRCDRTVDMFKGTIG